MSHLIINTGTWWIFKQINVLAILKSEYYSKFTILANLPWPSGQANSKQLQDLESRIQELEEENEQLTETNLEQEETIGELGRAKEELESRLAETESRGGAEAASTAAALANLNFDDDDVEVWLVNFILSIKTNQLLKFVMSVQEPTISLVHYFAFG